VKEVLGSEMNPLGKNDIFLEGAVERVVLIIGDALESALGAFESALAVCMKTYLTIVEENKDERY
jgi:hypothetical protein